MAARRPRRYLVRYKTRPAQRKWKRLPRFITRASGFRTRLAAERKLLALRRRYTNLHGHVDTFDHVRLLALAEARHLIGVMEHGGNNRGEEVERIISENGGVPGEPWCGDFVAHCYRHAGSRAVDRTWAAVRLLGTTGGARVLDKRWGEPGDIIKFTFDHTGILEHYADHAGNVVHPAHATHVQTIEGNTGRTGAVSDSTTGGDGVYRKLRPLDDVAGLVMVTR